MLSGYASEDCTRADLHCAGKHNGRHNRMAPISMHPYNFPPAPFHPSGGKAIAHRLTYWLAFILHCFHDITTIYSIVHGVPWLLLHCLNILQNIQLQGVYNNTFFVDYQYREKQTDTWQTNHGCNITIWMITWWKLHLCTHAHMLMHRSCYNHNLMFSHKYHPTAILTLSRVDTECSRAQRWKWYNTLLNVTAVQPRSFKS